MRLSSTKVKLTIGQSVIELEGSEAFVEKHWEELKSFISRPMATSPIQPSTTPKKEKSMQNSREKVAKTRKGLAYTPIPVDLKGNGNVPPLSDFYKKKSPGDNQEIITVFAYYLTKFCDIQNVQMGHIVTCYNEVGVRKPSNIYELCRNIRRKLAYLENGDEPYSFKITIQGENLAEHDLPRKQGK